MKVELRAAFFAGLLWSAGTMADEDPGPVADVVAAMPQQGTLNETVVAYGTATAAANAYATVSLAYEGRVEALAVTRGQSVSSGQKLLEFSRSAAAQSSWQQAQSALRLAQQEQARTARLLGQQLATAAQKAQADKAVVDAIAARDALRSEGGDAATRSLRAAFAGTVASIAVKVGDRIGPGTALLTLTRADGLIVTVGIEPAQRKRVIAGQPAQLTPLEDPATRSEARLLRVDTSINPQTRLVDVDLTAAPDSVEGEAYRAEIVVGSFSGWKLPRNAVRGNPEAGDMRPYLFQIVDGKAHRVTVEIVGSAGNEVIVRGPVDAMAPLIVAGNYPLAEGMRVRLTADGP